MRRAWLRVFAVRRQSPMFTPIDKNLLIAALESAIYHACVNANIVSLHAIESGVSLLRQRFDADPVSVTEADIFGMVETIERATIPAIAQISVLDNSSNIADRVVSFLWKNIIDKPATFPPAGHGHAWSEVTYKPATFPPATHQHPFEAITEKPNTYPPDAHAHAYASITDKPATFPPAAHTHPEYEGGGATTWDELAGKPATFPPSAHTHPEYAGGGGSGGGSPISRTWVGNSGSGTTVNIPVEMTMSAMIVYEMDHGFRAFWSADCGENIAFDDGYYGDMSYGAGYITLPPGLCSTTGKNYYAIIWGEYA